MMACKDIREQLSAYLEGTVSPEDRAAIEDHLKSCSLCSEALSDLSKTLECVKNLEEVAPPPWLTQKVMARIRAEARPGKSLFRRLFYPLHVKLPIEAVATVLVVGLALYVYRDIAPEVKLAQVPVEKSAPEVLPEERKPMTAPSPEGASKGGDRGLVEKKVPAPGKPAEKPASSREPEAVRDRLEATSRAPEAMKQAEPAQEAATPAPARKTEPAPAAGMVAKDEARQETKAAAPKAKLLYTEKQEEKTLSFIVFVKNTETAVRDIEKTLKELDGKKIHTESVEGKKVVSAVIKADKLHELSEKLKSIGETRQKELDLKDKEADVMLRIEVTRSKPSSRVDY